jgi:hypothetical protein
MFNVVSLSSYLHLEENAALAQKLRWRNSVFQLSLHRIFGNSHMHHSGQTHKKGKLQTRKLREVCVKEEEE